MIDERRFIFGLEAILDAAERRGRATRARTRARRADPR
jgi:hypothetical protein